MIRKIMIHAGRAKTGTTAIQDFCSLNRKLLADHGILYPHIGSFASGHHPIAAALSESPPQWMRKRAPLEDLVVDIVTEADEAGAETLLISSEGFQGTNITPLIGLFPDSEIEVLIYIRRYDRFYESLVGHDIRVGVLDLIPSFADGFYNRVLHHAREVENFARVIGPENIRVNIYDGKTDIRPSFALQIGLPHSAVLSANNTVERANPGLSSTDIAAMLTLNRIYPRIGDRRAVINGFAGTSGNGHSAEMPRWWQSGQFLEPKARQTLLDRLAGDLETLANRFGVDPAFCDIDSEEAEALRPAALPPAEEAFRRLAEVASSDEEFRRALIQSSDFMYRPLEPQEYSRRVHEII